MKRIPKIHIGMRIWKTVIAVFLCAIAGLIFDIHPFYSMIAAILCMQATNSESVKKGVIRCIGTFIGGLAAVIILLIIDFTPLVSFSLLYYVLISLCIAPVIYLTVMINRESSAFIACVVFLSIVLSHFDTENHYLFAVQRMLETIAGIIIALIINRVIKSPDKNNDKGDSKV